VSVIKTEETDVLILCGGLGTRFRGVREDIPKALAPIQGVPFIDLLLNDLIVQSIR
jgi:D-glycero-alpha-D-manno-heptose 1-phosphate guanylyltransferase